MGHFKVSQEEPGRWLSRESTSSGSKGTRVEIPTTDTEGGPLLTASLGKQIQRTLRTREVARLYE